MEPPSGFSTERSRFTAFSPASAARLNQLAQKSENDILKEQNEAEKKVDMSEFVPTGLTERQQLALLLSRTGVSETSGKGVESLPVQPSVALRSPIRSPRVSKTIAAKKISTRTDKIPSGYSEWSVAKRKAWDLIESNPNAYYYRHLAPGEAKKEGKWTEAEHILFLRVLSREGTKTNRWGMFGKEIPGRVGYQCRNYYHMLLSQGLLKDPDYTSEGKYSHKKVKSEDEEIREVKIRNQARALLKEMGEDWEEDSEEMEEEEMEVEEEKEEVEEDLEEEEEMEVEEEEKEEQIEPEEEKEKESILPSEEIEHSSPKSLLPREKVVNILASQPSDPMPAVFAKPRSRLTDRALELQARKIEYEQFRRIAEVEKQAKEMQEREAKDVERARLRVQAQQRSVELTRKRALAAMQSEREKEQDREQKRARSWERKFSSEPGVLPTIPSERAISRDIKGGNDLFIPHPHSTVNVWDAPSAEARKVALRALHVRFESEWLKVKQAFHDEIGRELSSLTSTSEFGFSNAVGEISNEPSPIGLSSKGPKNTASSGNTVLKRIHAIGDKFSEGVASLLSLQRMEAQAICAVHRAQLFRELQARGALQGDANEDSLSGVTLSPNSAKALGMTKIPSVEEMVNDLDIVFPYELELPSF